MHDSGKPKKKGDSGTTGNAGGKQRVEIVVSSEDEWTRTHAMKEEQDLFRGSEVGRHEVVPGSSLGSGVQVRAVCVWGREEEDQQDKAKGDNSQMRGD